MSWILVLRAHRRWLRTSSLQQKDAIVVVLSLIQQTQTNAAQRSLEEANPARNEIVDALGNFAKAIGYNICNLRLRCIDRQSIPHCNPDLHNGRLSIWP